MVFTGSPNPWLINLSSDISLLWNSCTDKVCQTGQHIKKKVYEVSNTKGCAYHSKMSKRAPDKVSPKNCDRTQNDSANTSIERSNRHIPAQIGQKSFITTISHTHTKSYSHKNIYRYTRKYCIIYNLCNKTSYLANNQDTWGIEA